MIITSLVEQDCVCVQIIFEVFSLYQWLSWTSTDEKSREIEYEQMEYWFDWLY